MVSNKTAGRPEAVKSKKLWPRRALMVIAGLIFVFIVAVLITWWSFYTEFVRRARESSAQSLLHHLAVSQMIYFTEAGRYFTNWNEWYSFGLRLDPNVRLKLIVLDLDIYGCTLNIFLAIANHARDKTVYAYSSLSQDGVIKLTGAKALGDEYAWTGGYDGDETAVINGWPPITVFRARLPRPGGAPIGAGASNGYDSMEGSSP